MSLSATIKLALALAQTASGDIESANSQANPAYAISYSDGAGAGQANVLFTDRRTIAASANESLDLSGALANLLGSAVFARVKAIVIKAADANPADGKLRVTRPASNGVAFANITAGDSIFPDIAPGGIAIFVDPGATGTAVTAATGDLVNIANTSATAEAVYDIIVIGAAT
jgi:hypothetical protein